MPSSPRPAPHRVARTHRGHLWGETWRVLAALAFGLLLWAAVASGIEGGTRATLLGDQWIWFDLVIGLVSCVLLLFRRRWPFPVTAVVNVLSAVSLVSSGAATIALISLATTRRWRPLIGIVPFWIFGGWVSLLVYRQGGAASMWADIAIAVLLFAFCLAVGFYIGERRAYVASLQERALTAEREQAMRVVQAELGERTRIAREMHDVLAHRISLVAMHSGALTYRTDLSREEIAQTAEIVRQNANRALAELRTVLGVLRDTPSSPRPDAAAGRGPSSGLRPEPPQPTLADLDELLAEARGAGAMISVERSGDLTTVPSEPSRHAYRILQECLTNARKHAPGRPVQVALARRPVDDQPATEVVELTVRNRMGDGAPGAPPGAGLGLIGLTERAVLAGGGLTHGRDRASNFVVSAWLPWTA